MKKVVLSAVFALFSVGFSFAQDDVQISQSQLPASVKRNVTKYFGSKTVSSVTKDREDGRIVYDVYFEDGSEGEFTSNGTLWEAKSYNGLSNNIVSAKVLSYVKKNYPGANIIKWEKKRNKQKVELDNDLDLEFTLAGKFLRVDD